MPVARVNAEASYRFRWDGNDKVKVNHSTFPTPDSPLPTPDHSGVTGIDIRFCRPPKDSLSQQSAPKTKLENL